MWQCGGGQSLLSPWQLSCLHQRERSLRSLSRAQGWIGLLPGSPTSEPRQPALWRLWNKGPNKKLCWRLQAASPLHCSTLHPQWSAQIWQSSTGPRSGLGFQLVLASRKAWLFGVEVFCSPSPECPRHIPGSFCTVTDSYTAHKREYSKLTELTFNPMFSTAKRYI